MTWSIDRGPHISHLDGLTILWSSAFERLGLVGFTLEVLDNMIYVRGPMTMALLICFDHAKRECLKMLGASLVSKETCQERPKGVKLESPSICRIASPG